MSVIGLAVMSAPPSSGGVKLRTVALRDRYFEALRAEGLDAVLLQRCVDNRSVPGVRVCDMHRIKGLEFRRAIESLPVTWHGKPSEYLQTADGSV